MKNKPDLELRRGSAVNAKAAQIRAFRLAFTASQPAREEKLKELLAATVRQEEAQAAVEAEIELKQAELETKRATEQRQCEESALADAERAAADKILSDQLEATKNEELRINQAAFEARRISSLSDEGVRKAQRARRIAARS